MSETIYKALDFITARKSIIDSAAQLQKQVWLNAKAIPHPLLLKSSDVGISFPAYNVKEAFYDPEKMLVNGLKEAVRSAAGEMQAVPSIRANMGCGIYPTLFGVRQELFEDKMPWIQTFLDKDTIKNMTPKDLCLGSEFKAGLDHMAYIAQKLEGIGCRVFPLDLQGPFDIAHLVYGDDIFTDMYDDPGFVHHLLELSVQAIIMGMDECLKRIPGAKDEITHYNELVMPRSKGGLKISEDTSTLISGEMIKEFVAPYTSKVLEHYGGGYIHYCGKNPHLMDMVLNMPLAHGLNLGNTDMHDMEQVLKACAKNGKVYYGPLPMAEGETYNTYFRRLISWASADDKLYLLLRLNHEAGTSKAEIIDAWHNAQKSKHKPA
ncbi:MAG: hypothetical protein FWE42_03990 [Defluviitaleaceae bacterium]|nr:hypothetical protein [Defluviitaleaceae bacterium]